MLLGIRAAALVALIACALATPGFLTTVSMISLLTTMSFIGCVAVGMTFITLSGNIMSFALGATLGVTTIVFTVSLPLGLAGALLAACTFSAAITGLQGFIIGYFRANPIIISMAALALIFGIVTLITGGRGIYPEGSAGDVLKGNIGPIPKSLLTVLVGQIALSFTRFGRNVIMVGSNRRAAEAVGIETWQTITGAYLVAGLFTAFSSVLMAARYASGDMEHGLGYDYHAISAVLVGGTAIGGGEGSVIRTLSGAFIIAVVEGLLLLNGFTTQWQYLIIGLIVLGVIMLQTLGER
ncbi:MAG: ABC transporter permease [Alphaproteobacteria bacterium]|nr:ABC transporter permease [Alphaproteobacteria bacterium]